MGAHQLKFKIELLIVNIFSLYLFLRKWNKDELDRIFVIVVDADICSDCIGRKKGTATTEIFHFATLIANSPRFGI